MRGADGPGYAFADAEPGIGGLDALQSLDGCCVVVGYLGQFHEREYYCHGKHHDAHDGIGYRHVAAAAVCSEQKLQDAIQRIPRMKLLYINLQIKN